jgi:hypothetical protein
LCPGKSPATRSKDGEQFKSPAIPLCPDELSEAAIKLGDVVVILDLHRQGLSVSAIARELGIDREIVRRGFR